MTDANMLRFPPDHRDPRWWHDSRVVVRWEVERECDSPLVTGVGSICIRREAPVEDGDDEDLYMQVGRIVITKVPLGRFDAVDEMDALSGDHEQLASQVLDGGDYEHEFCNWLMDQLGDPVLGDPVFVIDLTIDTGYRDPDCVVAAHAALDALATFGNRWSPLITFHRGGVNPDMRESLDDEGLWAWVHALRAKQWKQTYVAVCGW